MERVQSRHRASNPILSNGISGATSLGPTGNQPKLEVTSAPTPITGCAITLPLNAEQRQRRAEVVLRMASLSEPEPDPQEIAERHRRHREAFAERGLSYTPVVLRRDGAAGEIVDRAVKAQLKRAQRQGPLTQGRSVAHARSLLRQEIADLDIREIGEGIGSGVFARSAIRRGTFLGAYTGELRFLPADVMWPFLTANGYAFEYGAEISLKKGIAVIDGLEAGNFTRFLNHSYHPNAASRQLLLEDGVYTYFVAQRDIAPGEQVSINYSRGYWKGRGRPTPL